MGITKKSDHSQAWRITQKGYASLAAHSKNTLNDFEEAWVLSETDIELRPLIAAGALLTYFSAWSSFIGMKTWLQRFSQAHDVETQTQTPIDKLRLCCGHLCATRLADDDAFAHIDVDTNFTRALSLLKTQLSGLALEDVITCTPILAEICQVLRRSAETHEIELLIVRAPGFNDLVPVWRGRFWDWLSAAYFVLDDQARYRPAEEKSHAIADQYSLDELSFDIRKRPIRAALEELRIEDAKVLLNEMRTFFDPTHIAQATEYWDMDGRIKLCEADYSGAEDSYRRALSAAVEGESPTIRFIVLWAMSGAVALAMDSEKLALERYQKTVDSTTGIQQEIMRAGYMAVLAWFELKKGAPEAKKYLSAAFVELSRLNLLRFMRPLPKIAAQICLAALEHDIEPDFCKRVIALRGLRAPRICSQAWPHAFHVTTLGGLHINIDGKPMPGQSKPQVKPLQLVKLLAANEGLPLPVSRVLIALWPESSPETARASFDNALARLKKLLGNDDVIRLDGGKLTADASLIWFDTRSLSELVLSLETSQESHPILLARNTDRLLKAYAGAFLHNEDEEPWALAARERFQHRFLRTVESIGLSLESVGDTIYARTLYQRALDVEPLAESLYRRLMQCHKSQGNLAEAIQVYRRCRRMLSVTLSIAPSAQTEALMKEIYAADLVQQAESAEQHKS